MRCERNTENLKNCTCTYTACGKRGTCCECLRSHLGNRELPGCCFPPKVERTYDRSFEAFAHAWNL